VGIGVGYVFAPVQHRQRAGVVFALGVRVASFQGRAGVTPRKAVEREDDSMDRKLLVLAALGVSVAGCGAPATNNAAFNEAAAMNTPVESPPPADNAADMNAAAPADNAANAATP
jgi:hypothetical protein